MQSPSSAIAEHPPARHHPAPAETDGGAPAKTSRKAIADRAWSPPIDGHGLFKSLMLRLPRGVRRSFDHEQLLAIRQAAEEMAWGEHPIDIRLRLPWPGGRRYVVLLGGRDQRGPAKRLQRHARTHAVRVGNLASGLVLLALGLVTTMLLGLAFTNLLSG